MYGNMSLQFSSFHPSYLESQAILNNRSINLGMSMFGKPRESQKPEKSPEKTAEKPNLQDIQLPPRISLDNSQQDTLLQTQSTTTTEESELNLESDSELVSTVEKISRIVSPYFVVVVGLALYDNNFLIGTILILVGILSLLKVSTKDVATFLEWIKNFLGFNN